jgi:hypothetical protein
MQPSSQQLNNIAAKMGETEFSLLLFHVGKILSKKFEITLSLLSLMNPKLKK